MGGPLARKVCEIFHVFATAVMVHYWVDKKAQQN